MKRGTVVLLLSLSLIGCGEVKNIIGGSPTPTPTPAPTPVAKPTPAPADWMWKGYKNPLDTKKK